MQQEEKKRIKQVPFSLLDQEAGGQDSEILCNHKGTKLQTSQLLCMMVTYCRKNCLEASCINL